MKEFGPTRFERLIRGNQDRSEMIQENLEAWLSKNNQIETTSLAQNKNQEENTPLPSVKKVPKPLRKITYAGLTLTVLAAACTTPGEKSEEASQPQVEPAGTTERFLDLPFPEDPNMNVQQGWLEEDGDEHKGVDFIKGIPNRSATWEPFPVLASADGAACAIPQDEQRNPAFGNAVLIEHQNNYETYFGHLADIEDEIPTCRDGRTINVAKEQQIGTAGSTGVENPRWIHLHFQVRDPQGRIVDPYDLYAKRAEYPNPNFTNDKVCGQNHLWIYCPTTLLEQVSAPTPTLGQPQVLSTQDIKILRENLRQCRVSPDSTELSQDYWGGWIVKNTQENHWIKNFNALIELKSPEGFVVNSVKVEGARVVAPAGEETWIIGTGRGGIGSREIFPVFAYSGQGSRVADINLILTGPFNWEPIADRKTDYHLTSQVLSHELNNPYNLAPGYGRHELTFQITNTGNLALTNPSVFGFVYNLRGELVDMVWGWLRKPKEQNFIATGETLEITANSVSNQGRCVGEIDPVGYTLEYFVDFQGINENALSFHDIVGVR